MSQNLLSVAVVIRASFPHSIYMCRMKFDFNELAYFVNVEKRTREGWLYYELPYETKGSGELIKKK